MTCKELTKEELKCTNGCGSSYWLARLFRIPDFVSKAFTRCCNFHDRSYAKQENKNRADDELLDCWYYDAFHSPKWQRWWKLKLADLGYWAITSKLSDVCYRANLKTDQTP